MIHLLKFRITKLAVDKEVKDYKVIRIWELTLSSFVASMCYPRIKRYDSSEQSTEKRLRLSITRLLPISLLTKCNGLTTQA